MKANATSLGFDLTGLVRRKKIVVDYVHIEPGEVQESGEYDLEGLFVRLNHAIDSIGAKRVVLDTLEALFAGLRNEAILRAELRRLFRWLKGKGVTAVITAERGHDQLTRHGLEEYVSDCVILLDHRVNDQIATRHLRVVKYRGALHGTNEFPFLIGEKGLSVLPITSLGLNHKISSERVDTGIPRLDAMLGGRGFFRGSSILLTGTAGTGKTIVAANFAHAACQRGERALFFSFEESPNQIIRNLHSIGLRLEPLVKRGLLRFHSARPSLYGLEMHLATMFKEIAAFQPHVIIIDPITSLMDAGTDSECKGMVTRLIDYLKAGLVTSLFTSLTQGGHALQQSEASMSSLMDSRARLPIWASRPTRRGAVARVCPARGATRTGVVSPFLCSSVSPPISGAAPGAGHPLGIRLAQAARCFSLGRQHARRGFDLFSDAPQFHGVGIVVGAKGADLLFNRRAFAFQFALTPGGVLLAGLRLGFFAGGLRRAGRAGQHAAGTDVSIHKVNAAVRNQELADLVRVRHAARFEHVEHAIAFAVALEVLQQQPRT